VIRASRGRAAFLLALMFVAGLAVGLAAERYTVHYGPDRDRDDRRERRTTIERFADDLGITPEQQERIDPILVETRERMSDVFDQVRPEWEAVVDSARARIEAVLTPEQVERYRALLEEQEGRRRSEEDEHGSS
jgi:Spy/CpxP family protein refolding chaperone